MEDLPFWLGLARRAGSPILELGCGTGRLLVPLATAGFSVYGLDREPVWLAFMRSRLRPGTDAASQVFAADMSAYHLARRFALILLPCNTFSTLSPTKRRAALACIRRQLAPDGLFAASLPNPGVLSRLPRTGESEIEEEFTHPITGNPVQVSSAWERTGEQFILWWHYDHLLPDGRVERQTIETRHALSSTTEYVRDLASAGLEIVESYGNYEKAPAARDAPYWIFIASQNEKTPL
jgi:SAM-dependent methyltransferase